MIEPCSWIRAVARRLSTYPVVDPGYFTPSSEITKTVDGLLQGLNLEGELVHFFRRKLMHDRNRLEFKKHRLRMIMEEAEDGSVHATFSTQLGKEMNSCGVREVSNVSVHMNIPNEIRGAYRDAFDLAAKALATWKGGE